VTGRIAYVDLASGASGDMLLAALADAGAADAIATAVDTIPLDCSVSFQTGRRGPLRCTLADVRTDGARHTVAELRSAIAKAGAGDAPTGAALRGLDALVDAEAAVHGIEPSEVVLHELGSSDTAADLLGAAVGFAALGVREVHAAPVPVARGWTGSDHGPIPLPAPATLQLLRGAPLQGVDSDVELVTPTACAILVGHHATFGIAPPMVLEDLGTGGGARDTERPNVCRVLIGSPQSTGGLALETNVLLECNIDDQSPEALGWAMDALLRAGALDVWCAPIVMKKSRPAFQLSVLASPADEHRILEVLFRETTTLGTRRREVSKWVLPREELHVPVRGTNVRVKVGRLHGEVVNIAPEFDDCATVAERSGASLKEIYAEASERARRLLDSQPE
jgi:pyridinium-3,5-bisthiocarboxylic acid mononucleotide nickel chelatase